MRHIISMRQKRYFERTFLVRFVPAVLVLACPRLANADIIFSNFSPVDGSGAQPLGYSMSGSFAPSGYFSRATSFVPTADFTLTSFEIAAQHTGGINSTNSYSFRIVNDASGVPGATNIAVVSNVTLTTAYVVNTFIASGALSSGTQYWLVFDAPSNGNTRGIWGINSVGSVGGWANRAGNGSTWSVNTTNATPVFRVNGNIAAPEPENWILFLIGGVGFCGLRRRKDMVV